MSGIAGLRGTGNWAVDERPKSFRENILWMNPAGDSPIFALTSKAGKRSVTDPEFTWYSEGMALVRLQVNGAVAAIDTLITVDSADPGTSTLGANYGTATHLKPGDLLLVEPVTDTATFNHEIIMVENVLGDTQFTARRGQGGSAAAIIADNIWLTLIGSAYAEGTGAPRAVSRNPLKFNNFTQIFKDTYELTGTANETDVRTGTPWSNDKKRKGFDHSRAIEFSMLFGRKNETTGDNGKPLRFMGGLREYIPASQTTVFAAATTRNSFFDALAPAFDFNTGAGDTRILLVGNQAAIELAKLFAGQVTFQVNNVQKVYGMAFQEFIMPMGRVLIKTHPLLSRHGLYKKSGFLLDFDAIKYVYLRNRDTDAKDDVQSKDEDVRRGFYQTECSLEVGYGGMSMAYLGNISNT